MLESKFTNFRPQCEAALQLRCHDRHEHTGEQGGKAEAVPHLRLYQDQVRLLQAPQVEGVAKLHQAQPEPQRVLRQTPERGRPREEGKLLDIRSVKWLLNSKLMFLE